MIASICLSVLVIGWLFQELATASVFDEDERPYDEREHRAYVYALRWTLSGRVPA